MLSSRGTVNAPYRLHPVPRDLTHPNLVPSGAFTVFGTPGAAQALGDAGPKGPAVAGPPLAPREPQWLCFVRPQVAGSSASSGNDDVRPDVPASKSYDRLRFTSMP